jgi:HK97 family phage major capsid protein/HK97 family phage prohead protease
MPELLTREIQLAASKAAGDLIPCVLASETPVARAEYFEVLSHAPGDIDLRRAPLPLLVMHDHSQLNIGVVEQLRIEGGKLKGMARFGSTALAQEILADVKAGIVRSLSVGYQLLKRLSQAGDTVRFAWAPYEVSAVGVPADPQAGFYRSNIFPKGSFEMTDTTVESNTPSRSQRRAQGIEAERERMLELNAMGRAHNMRDAADRAVDNGTSVDEFREFVLRNLRPAAPLRVAESPDIGMSAREIEQYSIRRAILSVMDPTFAAREGGYEVECSRAAATVLGRNPEGLFIPADVLRAPMRRDLVAGTPSAGGNLVGTEHLGDSFVGLLRERNLSMEFGATVLGGLSSNLSIPTQTGAGTAFWVTEGTPITESQAVFGQIPMTPKTVGAFTDFSRKMLLQSSPDVESLVRADLAGVLAGAIDRAVFNGSGVGAEPLGLLGQVGVGSVAIGATGGAMTWTKLLELEQALHMVQANGASGLAYLTTPAARRKLKDTLKVSGDAGAGWLWENGTQDGFGTMNGYRAAATSHLPSTLSKGGSAAALSAMIFGHWPDVLIGMWGGLDILVDPYSMATAGGKRIVALMDVDIAIRRVASFAICADIATT